MAGNVEKDSHSDQKRHERGSPVAYEGQRDSRERYDVEVHSHIYERLDQYPRSDSHGDVPGKGVVHPACDAESPISDVTVRRNEEKDPHESELFGNHRKNEIPLNLREVSKFLNGFPESKTEESPGSYGDEALFRLEIDRPVFNGTLVVRKKVVDAFGNIRKRVSLSFGGFSEGVNTEGED